MSKTKKAINRRSTTAYMMAIHKRGKGGPMQDRKKKQNKLKCRGKVRYEV